MVRFHCNSNYIYILHYQATVEDGLSSLTQLQRENVFLTRAKEQLEEDFLAYKREISLVKKGNATKEVKILKKVIKNLEVLFV